MSGERIGRRAGRDGAWREPALPQPGDREPAPGELACVQAFVNSHYDLECDHGADLFATPESLHRWLARRGLLGGANDAAADDPSAIGEADVARTIDVREGLRALAGQNGGPRRVVPASGALNEAARTVTLRLELGEDGPVFIPSASSGLDHALGAVIAITARAMIDGRWSRLKVCPGDDCGWMFYDHSRNQSGRWCSMAICGGRSKARAHYRRRRGED
jgi:predicted RNA-binding Zn ribbon-like protein